MRRSPLYPALLVVLSFIACDGSDPLDPEQLPGSYELVTISGHSMPMVRREAPSDPSCLRAGETGAIIERINGGTLEIDGGAAFELEIRTTRLCVYDDETVTASPSDFNVRGTYEVERGRVVLIPANPDRDAMDARQTDSQLIIGLVMPNDVYRDYAFTQVE